MKTLKRIEITSLRNIEHISLELNPGFNLLYGKNGSGKTSFLEAIYLLGHGYSFRNRSISRVIREGDELLTVFGRLETDSKTLAAGIERHKNGKVRVNVNEEVVSSVAELAKLLPIQLINPDSHAILLAGPKIRRQFLDWGVFHVEHSFYPLWKKLGRVLKQRNAALKSRLPQAPIKLWDSELIELSLEIDVMRVAYIQGFEPVFERIRHELLTLDGFSMTYHRGWASDEAYSEVLERSFSRDLMLGYTQYGPQRADLKCCMGKVPAQDVLSRGQQKLLVSAMRLAQGVLLKEQTGRSCLYLIDDLPAELDKTRREHLARVLHQIDAQVFVTGVELNELGESFEDYAYQMFHVEHGTVEAAVNSVMG